MFCSCLQQRSCKLSSCKASLLVLTECTIRLRCAALQNELFSLLGHEHLSGAAVLVFANKQDLKDAMRPAELSECLGLHTIKTHSYHIQSSCATTGEGLQEGLAWIAQKVHGQTK